MILLRSINKCQYQPCATCARISVIATVMFAIAAFVAVLCLTVVVVPAFTVNPCFIIVAFLGIYLHGVLFIMMISVILIILVIADFFLIILASLLVVIIIVAVDIGHIRQIFLTIITEFIVYQIIHQLVYLFIRQPQA